MDDPMPDARLYAAEEIEVNMNPGSILVAPRCRRRLERFLLTTYQSFNMLTEMAEPI
jgi:hypothetical protein